MKLGRAEQLIELTAEEGENWKATLAVLKEEASKLVGDIFLAAASISYIGPFTGVYRDKIIAAWLAKLQEYGVPCSETYKLRNVLGNPVQIRNWTINSLPSDTVSIDNATIATRSQRWPLMIDPQTQANKWIRSTYADNLRVVRLTNVSTYSKVIDSALKLGHIVLAEDVLEKIDPNIDNILLKAIFMKDGIPSISF